MKKDYISTRTAGIRQIISDIEGEEEFYNPELLLTKLMGAVGEETLEGCLCHMLQMSQDLDRFSKMNDYLDEIGAHINTIRDMTPEEHK